MKIAFFGSATVSVYVLDELEKAGFLPAVVVTSPDKPQGRGLAMSPNAVKSWAQAHGIAKIYDPVALDASFEAELKAEGCDLFIVAAYGKIMPKAVVEMPRLKTLNVHPSLLPRYRGASPLPSAMLDDAKHTGVTIMRLDEKMDHGPIVATKEIDIAEWPTYEEFEELMAREGGRLLASILPDWEAGKIEEKEQDHALATFTKKIAKGSAELDFSADPYLNFRKIQAYHLWPQAYFTIEHGGRTMRVKVTKASYRNGALSIERVIPEGKKEMSWKDFQAGYSLPGTAGKDVR